MFIYVTKGNVFKNKIPQGDGRLRVDVPPEEICQHRDLARRWRKQASSQTEEVVRAVSKGMRTFVAQYILLINWIKYFNKHLMSK